MNSNNNNGCGCHTDVNMDVCEKNINMLPMLQTYTTKLLHPNMHCCKNVLTQQMMACENHKYVICWDFDLNGKTITVPKNCILEFDGGSLKNGTIIGQDTVFINVGDVDIWGENLTREGTWREHSGGGGSQVQSDWNQEDDTQPNYIKNKPTIPGEQVQADWNQTNNQAKDFIKNKPIIRETKYIPVNLANQYVFYTNAELAELLGLTADQFISHVNNYNYTFKVTNSQQEVFIVPAAYSIDYTNSHRLMGIDGPLTITLTFQISNGVYLNGVLENAETTVFGAVSYNEEQDLDDAQKVRALSNIEGKTYNAAQFSGLGKKILSKNIQQVGGVDKNILEQSMMPVATGGNTVYVINYDYDLNGSTLNIPDGCTLEFDGGSIKNGTINASYVLLNDWKFDNVTFSSSTAFDFTSQIYVPLKNAKEFCETILAHKSLTSTKPTIFVFGSTNTYAWQGTLNINRKNVKLIGGGTIQGHIHIGYTAAEYKELHYDSYANTGHHCIVVDGLTFNKYNIIGTDTDANTIDDFVKAGDPDNVNHVSISLINVDHVKITNCFFDNVPYPIVYKANDTVVNQNVRRLNIHNCDFERCKVAVYAPTSTNDSLEYGDLEFSFNNIFPHQCGLILHDIDGLKIYNNVINMSSIGFTSDQVENYQALRDSACNMELYKCGQIIINGNSFYGEGNKYGIKIYSPGNLNCCCNTFASQRNSPSFNSEPINDSVTILLSEALDQVCQGAVINSNLFSNVRMLPIYVTGGQVRGLTIQDNRINGDYYEAESRIIWSVDGRVASANLQKNYQKEFLKGSFMLDLKSDVLDLIYNNRDFRGHLIEYIQAQEFTSKDTGKRYRVEAVTKTTPITVLSITGLNPPETLSYIEYLFDGTILNIPASILRNTEDDALEGLKLFFDTNLSSLYDTAIIAKRLWIKGKSNAQVCRSICIDRSNLTGSWIACNYQNLGYEIRLKDIDGKNPIYLLDNNLSYVGIDAGDNGKIVTLKERTFTLKTTAKEPDAYAILEFLAGTTDTNELFIYDDTYFTKFRTTETADVLSSIVNFAYSTKYSVNGSTITSLEANKEYGYEWNSWIAIRRSHVANYEVLNQEGWNYNPSDDMYYLGSPKVGQQFFDGEKPVWYDGNSWIDASGTAVKYQATFNLTNITLIIPTTDVTAGSEANNKLIPDAGYTLPSAITITMGGKTLRNYDEYRYISNPSDANYGGFRILGFDGSGGVMGDIEITAEATQD